MDNIRNPVSKREIVRYLKLRNMRLEENIRVGKLSEKQVIVLKTRRSEINRLLSIISGDTIRKEIDNIRRHFHHPDHKEKRVKK